MKGKLTDFERNKSEIINSGTKYRNKILPSKFVRIMCVIVTIIMVSVSLAILVQQTSTEQESKASIMAPHPPPLRPDLYVSSMQIIDAYGNVADWDHGLMFGSGQNFNVRAEITNAGPGVATAFSVDLYIDEADGTPKFCGRSECSGLGVGNVLGLSWRAFTSISGDTPVRVVADSLDTVIESNEGNNVRTLTNFVVNAGRTVAIYMCADNNIESYAIQDFVNEMVAPGAGSSCDLSIVVMMDRIAGYDATYGDWTGANYFFVKEGSTCYSYEALQELGEVNMGDPNTLHNFATWAFDRYRADNYVLIMWDHGGPVDGVCYDDTSGGDCIKMNELDTTLQDINTHIGEKLNLVGFDACFQGWLENYYAIRQWSDAVVGSAESEVANGWPYDTILGQLKLSPSMATSLLCSNIVQNFHTEWIGLDWFHTMSAFSGTGVSSVAASISALAQVLWQKLSDPTIKSAIQNARSLMHEFPMNGHNNGDWAIDAYEMALKLKSSVADTDIQNAAQNVINTFNTAGVVFDWACGNNYDSVNMRLCALLWPAALANLGVNIDFNTYRTNKFSVDTSWDEFLAAYYDTSPVAYIDSISPNPAHQGSSVTFTGHGYDFDGTIVGYNWRSSINGQLSTAASFSTSTLSVGTHSIYFKVKDDKGVWSTEKTSTMTINPPNNLPTATIGSISPNPATQGQTVSFSGSGTDSDGTIIAYGWRSSINGQLSTAASFSTSTLSVGTHTIFFKVQDDDLAWSTEKQATLVINAPNIPPTATIDSISPNPASQGQTISFSGRGTDSDGTIIAYNWRSSIDGQLNTAASFTTSTLSVGTHIIYFKVQDDDLAWSAEAQSTLVVNVEIPPTAPGMPINTIGDECDGVFMLTWTAASDTDSTPVARYELLEMKDGGGWVKLSDQITTTSFLITYRTPATYQYCVRAIDTANNYGPWSSSHPIIIPGEIRLTYDSGDSTKPAIAVDSTGNYHVVWQYSSYTSNPEIFYMKLDPNWNIITPKTQLTNNMYYSIDPDIAVSGTGVIKVIWCDNRDGNYEIYIKTYNPSTSSWGADTRLTKTTSANDKEPDVDVDSSGNFYFVWHDSVVNSKGLTEKIWFSVNGGSASSIYTATGPKGGIYDKISEPRLACGATGVIHLAFDLGPAYPAETGTESIKYMKRTSSTWSSVSTLKTSTGSDVSDWVSIDADSAGNVYVAWQQLISLNPYSRAIGFIRSSNGGTSWNPNIIIPGTETTGLYPEVSCLSNGRIYLGFFNDPGTVGLVNVAKSLDYGATWSIQTMSPSTMNVWYYSICVDPNSGRVGIVWDCAGATDPHFFEIHFAAKML